MHDRRPELKLYVVKASKYSFGFAVVLAPNPSAAKALSTFESPYSIREVDLSNEAFIAGCFETIDGVESQILDDFPIHRDDPECDCDD